MLLVFLLLYQEFLLIPQFVYLRPNLITPSQSSTYRQFHLSIETNKIPFISTITIERIIHYQSGNNGQL